jgi:hypothetical protein
MPAYQPKEAAPRRPQKETEMTISIGPTGYIDLVSTAVDPGKPVRIISFVGPGDTGPIVHPHFRVGRHPSAIIDITAGGELVTSSFKTTVGANHSIRHQSDTGMAAALDGHTCWAICPSDTGIPVVT